MSYQRYFDPIQAESDQKDLIISQLKAELYELNKNHQDFSTINIQLNQLELKYQQLQEEQLRAEREGRQRSDQDLKTIGNLRVIINLNISQIKDEIDILRQEIQNRNREANEFRSDNSSLHEMVLFRTNELQKLRNEVQELQEQGKRLSEQRKNLERILKRLKDDKVLLAGENEQLQNEYEQLYQKQRGLEKSIKDTEYELAKIDKLLNQQSKLNQNLQYELKHKKDALNQAQARQQQNEKLLQQLQNEIGQFERQVQKGSAEAKENQNLYQQELNKSKDLQNRCLQTENKIRDKDLHLEEMRVRLDEQNLKRINLVEDNKFLNNEIDRVLQIINELNSIRKELVEEIQVFADEDQKAIALLSRNDRQKDMILRSNNKISSSMQTISHFLNKQGDQ